MSFPIFHQWVKFFSDRHSWKYSTITHHYHTIADASGTFTYVYQQIHSCTLWLELCTLRDHISKYCSTQQYPCDHLRTLWFTLSTLKCYPRTHHSKYYLCGMYVTFGILPTSSWARRSGVGAYWGKHTLYYCESRCVYASCTSRRQEHFFHIQKPTVSNTSTA